MPKHPQDLTHEELDPSIQTGVGNPLLDRTLLSEEDEKSVDDKGMRVLKGKLWSNSSTGRWLVVALHKEETATCLTPKLAQADITLGKSLVTSRGVPWCLTLMTTEGQPRFLHDTVGACLELPDDLAEDSLKRQYLTEWLLETVTESLENRKLRVKQNSRSQFAAGLADAAQVAISKAL